MTFSRPSPFGTSLILAALLVLLLTQCGPSGGSEASGTANAPDRSGAAADGEIPLGIAPVHWDATRPAAKPGLVGPLHTISLTSSSLELTRYFYEGGLRMTLDGPFPQPASKLHRQRQFWDLPDSIRWQTYRLHRPETPDAIQIRLLLLQHETPPVHQTPEARELGPLLLGFTNRHQARLDDSLRAKGFATLTGGTTRRLASAEGGDYRFYETVFRAPDFTLVAGIEGLDEPAALGPLDAQTGMGGPSYAVHVVDSLARFTDFLTKVLDWEIRAEQSLTVAAGSAWGLPEGTVLNTALAYAKGASSGQLLLVDYADERTFPPHAPARLPHRGLGMWTFRTRDLGEVRRRAEAYGSPIVYGPVTYETPLVGMAKVMTLRAPDGFMIEMFEQ